MFDLIAFDADDTLWHNETLFTETQARFRKLLGKYHDDAWIDRKLYETEAANLRLFGYGIKGFALSMIETAIQLSEGRVSGSELEVLLDETKNMLKAPVEVFSGVRETLQRLTEQYRLMVITKGDLFDQENKIARSGLGDFFDALEIVSEKSPSTYSKILEKQGVAPERFLMIGNSLKSDILPVISLGGHAVHIPYHTTWAMEQVDPETWQDIHFHKLEQLSQIEDLLRELSPD